MRKCGKIKGSNQSEETALPKGRVVWSIGTAIVSSLICRWSAKLGEPTDIQKGLAADCAVNMLITLPAAENIDSFLWALQLITGEWQGGGTVYCMPPLKALNNDVRRNLLGACRSKAYFTANEKPPLGSTAAATHRRTNAGKCCAGRRKS